MRRLIAAAYIGMAVVAAPPAEAKQRGEASWYGHRHHGQRMANGRRFDMHAPTVAHRKLPLGTCVMVRNLANGRRATATVTDRGPYRRGRVLDVSRHVAGRLGMVRSAVTPVEITVMAEAGR